MLYACSLTFLLTSLLQFRWVLPNCLFAYAMKEVWFPFHAQEIYYFILFHFTFKDFGIYFTLFHFISLYFICVIFCVLIYSLYKPFSLPLVTKTLNNSPDINEISDSIIHFTAKYKLIFKYLPTRWCNLIVTSRAWSITVSGI